MKNRTNLAVDPEEELPKVEKLIYSLAWDFARRYRMPYEDALSDAYLGFMKACRNYKPDKGTKFSTWCRLVTWGQLKSLLMQRAAKAIDTVELDEEIIGAALEECNINTLLLCDQIPARGSLASVLIQLLLEAPREMMQVSGDLSEDAQELLFLFLETPSELYPDRAEEVAARCAQFAQMHGKRKMEETLGELRGALVQSFS